ncbi:hypothetical protein WG922_15985 [Ramlibacter sp. AN1015]|uniref:type II toxin-antitoxin system RelE/ParE family toxin n=1 Tax=Ramlibacter sp. AN1015 TaxID=3133428 RepID=UPI0030C33E55
MDITFANKRLAKELNEGKTMVRVHGPLRTKKLQVLLTMLRAAPTLAAFGPPMSPPHRCHELTGDRQGQLTMDLDHPYRLVFRVHHKPLPTRPEGGLDWKQVTAIEICGIEDTHG